MKLNDEFMNMAVSNENIDYFDYEIIKNRFTCRYSHSHDGRFNISCPEATYQIKKWADKKGYSIHSNFSGNTIVNINKYEYFCDIEFNKESEFEAVYKAGLWVFEKLKEQK